MSNRSHAIPQVFIPVAYNIVVAIHGIYQGEVCMLMTTSQFHHVEYLCHALHGTKLNTCAGLNSPTTLCKQDTSSLEGN
jgi:hypothetical protein